MGQVKGSRQDANWGLKKSWWEIQIRTIRGPFFEAGLDLELDVDLHSVHGANLDDPDDPDEVNDDLELDFIVENRAQTAPYSSKNRFQKELPLPNSV